MADGGASAAAGRESAGGSRASSAVGGDDNLSRAQSQRDIRLEKASSIISLSRIGEYEETGRQMYPNRVAYLLSMIGFAIGLGNIWRFPRTVLDNGGGAFLIPYFTVAVLEALPMMIMETAIGQRFRGSPLHCLGRMHPLMWGIGACMCAVSALSSMYYVILLAWALVYFFNSFQTTLPWTVCNPGAEYHACVIDPASFYFEHRMLHRAASIDESFEVVMHVYMAVLICWGVVYLSIQGGVSGTARVVYFSSLFPYVALTVFLVIGVQLPGAKEGLTFVFKPSFEKILQPKTWMAATEQVFFSCAIGYGGMMSMASKMPVKHKAYIDTIIVICINCGTSLYSAIGIFSLKGNIAYETYESCKDNTVEEPGCKHVNATLDDYIRDNSDGTGLIYITLAKAVATLGSEYVALSLSMLLFLMVVTIGLASQIGNLEGILPAVKDIPHFKVLERWGSNGVIGSCIVVFAAISVIFASNHGEFFVNIFDKYGCVLVLSSVGLMELIAIRVYGMRRFDRDFKIMNGRRIPFYIKLCVLYITPVILVVSIVWTFAQDLISGTTFAYYDPAGVQRTLPWWAIVLSVALFLLGVAWAFIGIVVTRCCERKGVFLDWGEPDFNYELYVADMQPERYSRFEQLFFGVGEWDFPENLAKGPEPVPLDTISEKTESSGHTSPPPTPSPSDRGGSQPNETMLEASSNDKE